MNTTREQQIAAMLPAIKEQWREISAGGAGQMTTAMSEGRDADVRAIYRRAYAKQGDVVLKALLDQAVEALVSDAVERLGIKPPITGVR